MANEPPPSKPPDRWPPLILWLAMLAAVLVTSIFGITALATGGLLTRVIQSMPEAQLGGAPNDSGERAIAALSLLLVLLATGLIVRAWLRFADLSKLLIISYAELEEDDGENRLFSDMLIYPEGNDEQADTKEEEDIGEVDRTIVSDIVRYLAFAWFVLLIMSPLIVAASMLFQK